MTALEKFAAILEEIQKESAAGVPRGGRTMHPGWLGAGKPMSPTSPTRFMGAERGTIPPTKAEAMTSGVSEETVKSLVKGRLEASKPRPVQPAMPGKVVRPGPLPSAKDIRPPGEPKVLMEPVSSAGLHEAMGYATGQLAQTSRKVTKAPTFAVSEKAPVELRAANILRRKLSPIVSPEVAAKKHVARAAAEKGPSTEAVKGVLERKWRPVETAGEVRAELGERAAKTYRAGKEHVEKVLTQRAFEASKKAPEALPKYDPAAVALGKKVVSLPGEIASKAKEKAQAEFAAKRQALRAEISRRIQAGRELEPRARYKKPKASPMMAPA